MEWDIMFMEWRLKTVKIETLPNWSTDPMKSQSTSSEIL